MSSAVLVQMKGFGFSFHAVSILDGWFHLLGQHELEERLIIHAEPELLPRCPYHIHQQPRPPRTTAPATLGEPRSMPPTRPRYEPNRDAPESGVTRTSSPQSAQPSPRSGLRLPLERAHPPDSTDVINTPNHHPKPL